MFTTLCTCANVVSAGLPVGQPLNAKLSGVRHAIVSSWWLVHCLSLWQAFCFGFVPAQVPTIQGEATVYARQEGDTAVFPWRYNTTSGYTLDTIFWRKVDGSNVAIIMRFRPPDQYVYGPGYNSTKAYNNESAFLLLMDVQQGDIATYRCTVQHRDSMNIQVTVEHETGLKFPTLATAPVVTLPSPPPVVGSTTSLSCQSSNPGEPAATYQWYKGGTIITAVPGRYSFSLDGSTFTITGVQKSDEAMYSCAASNLAGQVSSTQHLMEVYYIPSKPSIQITVTSVLQDQGTVLTCRSADYKPDPTYSWRKGPSNVTTDGTRLVVDAAAGTLSINQAQSGDMGGYTCTATNAAGTSQTSNVQQLDVRYRSPNGPSLSGFDPDSPPFSGQPNPLRCQITGGNPLPTLVWTRDNVPITEVSTSTSGQTVTSQLTATLTAADNRKTYTCTENHVAAPSPPRSTSAVLEVYYAPDAPTVDYDGSPVVAGTTFSVTCATNTGNPTPSISWYKVVPEGVNQPAGTAGQLEFDPITKDSNGDSYMCTATNTATEHQGGDPPSRTIIITVHYPPSGTSIAADPEAVEEGDSLTLMCSVSDANPEATFTWSKAAGSLPSSASLGDSGQLTIPSIGRTDSGNFTCIASNNVPPNGTAHYPVNVLYLDRPVTNSSSQVTLVTGESLTTSCQVQANPEATVSWIHVQTGTMVNSAMLYLNNVTKHQSGTYVCNATNTIKGEQRHTDITLEVTVNYQPTIVDITPALTVDEFTDVSLSCTADSNPPPTSFTWNYNGAPLQTTPSGIFTRNTSIPGITHDQAGTYTCTVANGIPDSSTEVARDTVITVEFPPKFTHQDVPYTAAVGDTVNLTCSAIAESAITAMQWIRDGQALTTGGQFTVTQLSAGVSVLTIADVMEDNYGMYNCTAENSKGLKWSNITLQAQGPPDPPTNLRVVYKNPDGHVIVQWTAGFTGGLETTHTVDYRKLGAKDWTSGDTVTQTVSENHRNYNVSLQLGSQGNFTIRLTTSNSPDNAAYLTVDVLIEGETVLEGRLTVNLDFHPDYNNLDLQTSQDFISVVVAVLDETMRQAKLPGYQGSIVTKLSPGSIITDFEATVATSEVLRAISAFDDQVATGSLGSLSVGEGTLVQQSSAGDNTTVIIIAVVCAVVVVAIIGVGVFVVRRRKSANGKKDVELNERITRDDRPSLNGLANPGLDTENSPDPAYAEVPSNGAVQMSTGNPYDDVHFEGDGTTAPVAGATAGPLDPNVQYATVNKNNNETPNPSTVYAQVNKKKKKDMPPTPEDPSAQYSEVKKDKKKDKKDKEKPTLVVDPSSEYATVDKSKKKKKDMPPPPEDPSAQYSEVKKDKKKDKKASPSPDVIYTEVVKDKKDKKDKKEKKEKEKKPTPAKKPAVAKKPTVKNEERLYDEVPKAEGAAAATTDENPYENPQDSMPEKKKNPQGLIYAELSDFQVKPPPKKPSKPAPPKPRYQDEPTEYASINWNASRRRAQEQSQSGSTTDDETPVTMI